MTTPPSSLKLLVVGGLSWASFLTSALMLAARSGVTAAALPSWLTKRAASSGWLASSALLFLSACLPSLVRHRVGPFPTLSKLLLGRMRIEHIPNPAPRTQRGQRPSLYPPPFPNGWFRILGSWELKEKMVMPLRICGHDLVLYRTESGEAVVLDAYCPHLGAHLGVGGTVHGDCVRCPFHGWEIDKHGKCVGVPDCPPPGAASSTTNAAYNTQVEKWHVVEYFDAIFLWHDSEKRDPLWWPNDPQMPPPPAACVPRGSTVAEATSYFLPDQYYLAGSTHAVVNTHIQEMPENGPDVAHLNVLHTAFVIKWLRFLFIHKWTAQWSSALTNMDDRQQLPPHISNIYLTQCAVETNVSNGVVPTSFVPAYINQIGPGIVRLRIILGGSYEVVVHEYITPFAPTANRAVHTVHARHGTPRWLAQIALWALDAQFQRDVPIWEGKRYEPKPVLSPTDGPIPSFRRWFAQFYGPSSVPFTEAIAKEHMLDNW